MTDNAKTPEAAEPAELETAVPQRSRKELLDELLVLTNELQAEQASAKRDGTLHKNRVKDLRASIAKVTDNVKDLDEQSG